MHINIYKIYIHTYMHTNIYIIIHTYIDIDTHVLQVSGIPECCTHDQYMSIQKYVCTENKQNWSSKSIVAIRNTQKVISSNTKKLIAN